MIERDDEKTVIDPKGLRYKSKSAGSPFGGKGAFAGGTMSCLLCGKHRPHGMLKSRLVLGKPQRVCAPSCKALEAALTAAEVAPSSSAETVSSGAAAG